ncbi:MAG: hypothetical protein ACYCUF_06995 [Acidimicrobiales bacterium]
MRIAVPWDSPINTTGLSSSWARNDRQDVVLPVFTTLSVGYS